MTLHALYLTTCGPILNKVDRELDFFNIYGRDLSTSENWTACLDAQVLRDEKASSIISLQGGNNLYNRRSISGQPSGLAVIRGEFLVGVLRVKIRPMTCCFEHTARHSTI